MNVKTDWFKNKDVSAETLLFGILAAGFFSMPLGTAPPTALSIAAAAVWLLTGTAFRSREIYLRQPWCRPVYALILLPWVCLTYSPDPAGMGLDYAGKTHYWLYALAMAAVAARADRERLVQAFLAGLAANAVVGGMQLAGLYPPTNGWYCGFGRGYSTLSAYLVLGMLMGSYYFRTLTDRRFRRLALCLTGFYFFHLVILQGRTGYVTVVALLPLILRNILPRVHPVRVTAVCVLLAGLMFLSPIVRERVQFSVAQITYHIQADPEKAWGREYTDNLDRFYMWYGAVRIFLEHPVAGVGTGGFQAARLAMGKPGDPLIAHPHNDLLYMAASYGLIGIAVFIWFFWTLLRNAWRERETAVGYFVLSCGLVVLVSGLLNAQILDAGMAFLVAYAAGLQQGFSRPLTPQPKATDRP
ncbi:O-antigen ligase family protein [Desulfococcus sp.]|uniref:O-antigen ligase family protein n=1 Tax=Desulfococcus sp. TaxID=2025834 RepID=UPI00359384D2